MSKQLSPEDISKTFRNLFSTKDGQIVLDKIKTFCLAEPNQTLSCPASTNQTFYNLGANAVYRFILYQMNMQFDQSGQDCLIATENETGE